MTFRLFFSSHFQEVVEISSPAEHVTHAGTGAGTCADTEAGAGTGTPVVEEYFRLFIIHTRLLCVVFLDQIQAHRYQTWQGALVK